MTVIQILSAPTGKWGYAVIRKWWNKRMSAMDCDSQDPVIAIVCLRNTYKHAWR